MTTLTTKQRENLIKLANYLDTLTAEYANEHFRMESYFDIPYELRTYNVSQHDPSTINHETYNNCGTCACALGHGPAAGVKATQDDWNLYSKEEFGLDPEPGGDSEQDWVFVFGEENPDSPWQAAGRIREVLARNPDPVVKVRQFVVQYLTDKDWQRSADAVLHNKDAEIVPTNMWLDIIKAYGETK